MAVASSVRGVTGRARATRSATARPTSTEYSAPLATCSVFTGPPPAVTPRTSRARRTSQRWTSSSGRSDDHLLPAARSRQLPLPDFVGQVGSPLRRLRADRLQGHAARVHALEQADSRAEQHGGERDRELVDQAGV